MSFRQEFLHREDRREREVFKDFCSLALPVKAGSDLGMLLAVKLFRFVPKR
jgi:hypothetical protein